MDPFINEVAFEPVILLILLTLSLTRRFYTAHGPFSYFPHLISLPGSRLWWSLASSMVTLLTLLSLPMLLTQLTLQALIILLIVGEPLARNRLILHAHSENMTVPETHKPLEIDVKNCEIHEHLPEPRCWTPYAPIDSVNTLKNSRNARSCQTSVFATRLPRPADRSSTRYTNNIPIVFAESYICFSLSLFCPVANKQFMFDPLRTRSHHFTSFPRFWERAPLPFKCSWRTQATVFLLNHLSNVTLLISTYGLAFNPFLYPHFMPHLFTYPGALGVFV
jgi:hypothetical protein